MTCPYCGEHSSLKGLIKAWLWGRIPYSYQVWFERRKEAAELCELRGLNYPLGNIAKLTDREFFVFSERFKEKSFEEIAKQMNVTRERIRQIQAKAMRKLRRPK